MSARRPLQIVGAGPAGLAAALTARAAGADVTVYEKRPRAGARFHGDFQGIENWTHDEDVFEELERLGLSLDLERTPVREIVCFDPAGVPHRLRTPTRPLFYLIRRGVEAGTLDATLAAQAERAGVAIQWSTRRTRLQAGIVAEGPHEADIIAVGYTFATDMADGCYTALSESLAPGGYAYLLVHAGRGTLASCLFRDFHQEKVYLERVVAFFQRHAELRWQHAVPFGGSGNVSAEPAIRAGAVLYAGESAGLQDALFGFGVRYAILSGCFAARAWLAGSMPAYDERVRARIRDYVRTGIANRRLYGLLGDRGYGFALKYLVAERDPRRVLHQVYRPSRIKVALGEIAVPRRLTQRLAMPGCECTWCRCQANAACEAHADAFP